MRARPEVQAGARREREADGWGLEDQGVVPIRAVGRTRCPPPYSPSSPSEKGSRDVAASAPRGVVATCSLERRADALRVTYRITNRSDAELYILDAAPGVDSTAVPKP